MAMFLFFPPRLLASFSSPPILQTSMYFHNHALSLVLCAASLHRIFLLLLIFKHFKLKQTASSLPNPSLKLIRNEPDKAFLFMSIHVTVQFFFKSFNSGHPLTLEIVLFCWSCPNTGPQTGWLKHKFFFSQFCKIEVKVLADWLLPNPFSMACKWLSSPRVFTWSPVCANLCHNLFL